MLFITYDAKISIEQPSRRPVFINISITYGFNRDSSLPLRMTRMAGRQIP